MSKSALPTTTPRRASVPLARFRSPWLTIVTLMMCWLIPNTSSGADSLAVTNIYDPVELNAVAGAAVGDTKLVYQDVAGANHWTLYAWDGSSTEAQDKPRRMNGSTGQWIAIAGRVLNAGTGFSVLHSGTATTDDWQHYSRRYAVSVTTPATLLDSNGAAFSPAKSYLVRSYITGGTSTNTGAEAVFWSADGVNWTVANTWRRGQSSNHINLFLDGNIPKISTWHTSTYTVAALVEEISGSTGGGSAPWFGMNLTDDGTNLIYKDSTVWTASNQGAGSTLDADLLDGRDSAGFVTRDAADVTVTGAGWKRLAKRVNSNGRGRFKVAFVVSGSGGYVPAQTIFTIDKGAKGSATNGDIGISVESLQSLGRYIDAVRLVQEPADGSCYVEVNFISDVVGYAYVINETLPNSWVVLAAEAVTGTAVVKQTVALSSDISHYVPLGLRAAGKIEASDLLITTAGKGLNYGFDDTGKNLQIGVGGTTATNTGDVRFFNGKVTELLTLKGATGNLLLGTVTDDGANRLQVNGTIKAKEVIVTATGWSDHVFADGYRLRPLSEVAAYIATERHLPGVPAEKDLAETGLGVHVMLAKHMEKIEELTLYAIATDAENRRLTEANHALATAVEDCRIRLERQEQLVQALITRVGTDAKPAAVLPAAPSR